MANIIDFFKYRKSQEDRFTKLVRASIKPMYSMAYRWTQNRDDAEDLVQDTLTKLLDHVDEMEKVEKLNPWLIKVLYRCYIDFHRKRARSPSQDISDWRGDTSVIDEMILHKPAKDSLGKQLGLQRDLIKALESLNNDQRNIVLLHDSEGYSAAEIASILEISIGTVKSRLHRARLNLKRFLE
jgi:RNA polymerase sigma-70 factor, ECF subfamily